MKKGTPSLFMASVLLSLVFSAGMLAIPLSAYAEIIIPSDFSFQKNLKLGDTVEPDVRYLQNILNQSANTRVAISGAGSDAELSASFGPKTKDAVMRFQMFYAADVLTPAGLTKATGVVGALTRAKLNQILGQSPSQSGQSSTVSGTTGTSAASSVSAAGTVYNPYYAIGTANSAGVSIYGVSTYKAVPGQVVSVFGQGFDKNSNVIQIGSEVIKNLPSSSSNTIISFTVPQTLPTGRYAILVFNKFGLGSSGAILINIDASSVSASANSQGQASKPIDALPVLTAISPTNSKFLTQVVVVSGDNFTADNTLQTNLGNIYHLPSANGKILTFTIGNLPYYIRSVELYKGQAINLVVRVSNQYGVSKEQLIHVINLPASGNIADASPSNAADMIASTASYSNYQASTTYSLYVPYDKSSPDTSSVQSLFGLISALDFGGYGSLYRTATSSLNTLSGPSGNVAGPNNGTNGTTPNNVTPGGVVNPYISQNTVSNPYISNVNPYIIGPTINPPSNNNAYTSNGATAAYGFNGTTTLASDYFGGLIMKTTACTADGSTIIYVRDYAHEYRTYALTLDPLKTKVNGNLDAGKGDLNVGAYVSGRFTNDGKACLVGSKIDTSAGNTAGASSKEPPVLVDVSVGTIDFVQKMSQ